MSDETFPERLVVVLPHLPRVGVLEPEPKLALVHVPVGRVYDPGHRVPDGHVARRLGREPQDDPALGRVGERRELARVGLLVGLLRGYLLVPGRERVWIFFFEKRLLLLWREGVDTRDDLRGRLCDVPGHRPQLWRLSHALPYDRADFGLPRVADRVEEGVPLHGLELVWGERRWHGRCRYFATVLIVGIYRCGAATSPARPRTSRWRPGS